MNILYHKDILVKYKTDVLVIGGGPSGVAAAVSASNEGASTIIVEQTGSFGGMGTIGMVSEIMNFDDGENFLCAPFGKIIHDNLFDECKFEREWKIANIEKLKRLYDKLIEDANVKYLFFNKVTDCVKEDKNIKYAIVSAPEGVYAIEAKVFIDATGNAYFTNLAGIKTNYGDENENVMSATLCSIWGNVDFNKLDILQQRENLKKAYDEKVLSQFDMVLPGMKESYKECSVAGGNIGHAFNVDDRNSQSISKAMTNQRKILSEYEQYYNKYVNGCENATLLRSADFLGVRESRRAICDVSLTKDAFFKEEPFYDEIGRYSYPIDIHPMNSNSKAMDDFEKSVNIKHDKGKSYSIPYRALAIKDANNLLTCGRCLDADRDMMASVRVIPGCYITGQASGVAASLIVKDNCTTHNIDIKKLQKRLKDIGAYLR